MREDLLFANAVVKAKEEGLFSSERLNRMLDCTRVEDAVRILVEAGYGGGMILDDPYRFEKILKAEESILVKFISETAPEGVGFECFFLKADYHNVKALLKAKYQDSDPADMLLEGGLIPVAELKEKLAAEEVRINPFIDEAVRAIKKAFVTQKSPRLIDTLLDRAMYLDIKERLSAPRIAPEVKRYFTVLVDSLNIASFLRTAKIGGSYAFFASNFVEGGDIAESEFKGAFADAEAKLPELLRGKDYKGLYERYLESGLEGFDTARDNYLLDIFRKERHDIFSVAPVMGYYIAKQTEIKVLRIVLVCIKNGVQRAEIKKRLRFVYAE